jgi:DNA-binding response OmpR family regulator
MKLLLAEDDIFFQSVLRQVLAPEHTLEIASNGIEAWERLQHPDSPRLAILDWVMPGLTGPQICRKVRADASLSSMYLIILTSRNNEADIVSGLRAGADDYITKPAMPAELRARIRVGERILALQDAVEAQSVLGNQSSVRERVLREQAGSTHSLRLAARNPFCGIEPCLRQLCEPENCCSLSSTNSDRIMLGPQSPLEKCHPHRG